MHKKINERIKCITYSDKFDCLFAGGITGGIYRISKELDVLDYSESQFYNSPIINLLCYKSEIFARNVNGDLLKYDTASLKLISYLNSSEICKDLEEGIEEKVKSSSHGIEIFNNKIYLVSGTGNFITIDPDSMNVESINNYVENSYVECINTKGNLHYLSDFSGNIWQGNLEQKNFQHFLKLDTGTVHCTIYDKKFNRYWATTDDSFKIKIFNDNKEILETNTFTNDDIEWIDFSQDFNKSYVACFDHYLYCFNNEIIPELINKFGPFKFQLNFVKVIDDKIYVVLESGEIYKLDEQGYILNKLNFEGDCIWDTFLEENKKLYCGHESGDLAIYNIHESEFNSIHLSLENKINLKNGRVRRVSIDKYQYYGITTEGYLIAIQKETNEIVWKSKLEGICRDISINTENGSVYVATEANFIYEISSLSGEIIHQRKFDHPVWALAYHPAGYLIAGTRRNYLYLFKDLKNDYLDCLEHFGNQKGLKVLHNNNILLNGNGYIKEFEINQNRLKEVKRWKEGLNTTCEDVILDEENDRLNIVTYNMDIKNYSYQFCDHETLDNLLMDFPKSLQIFKGRQSSYLIVAGRGNYVTFFRIFSNNELVKINEFYL